MKNIFFIAALLLMAGSVVMAQTALMQGGSHDFTFSTGSVKGASEQLCNYCHTPHVPVGGINAPLWARKALQTTGYGVYNNLISSTMNANPTALAADQTNNSAMCMSCHDGSAIFSASAYWKQPAAAAGKDWATYATTTVGDHKNFGATGTYYGKGLSHTHPVNFTYDATLVAADGGLKDSPQNSLPLYSSTMQCGSCHNPHATTDDFVRVTLDGGKLCVSCHNK